jgi:hypothetical protein
MPLPSVLNGARQCQADSKRSGKRCLNPAAYGCKTCRYHGAHRPQEAPAGEDHWNYQHGKATKKKRAEDAAASTKLLLLRDLGVKLGMFGDQLTGWPGRRPRDYPATELMSAEELMVLIKGLASS